MKEAATTHVDKDGFKLWKICSSFGYSVTNCIVGYMPPSYSMTQISDSFEISHLHPSSMARITLLLNIHIYIYIYTYIYIYIYIYI